MPAWGGVTLPTHTPDVEDGGCSRHTEVPPARPQGSGQQRLLWAQPPHRRRSLATGPPLHVGGAEAGGGARDPSPDFRPLSSVLLV